MIQLKESAQLVQNKLIELGYPNIVIELPDSTRTAQEAADAIGCEVAHIAKSIIFRLKNSDKPLLVVASGANRINEKQIGSQLGEKLGKADADFVREHTGFVIGGVPPLGHIESILTFIDEDLFQYDEIWAAAGHPRAVFQLTPEQLMQMTKGKVICVK
ncbi:YbaK/EbsC family protein [Paenibacillus sp. J2TS4]|uniref:YbaK/EbsC family protein n=1 Tax=Paenibacillus sp. J2TS4 TaxID=2807194 RepID=UPI001B24555B|nr:YbaK/EbsC family protein [Paenibacillus sp. J2TS4]GIP33581.1 cys-tRNA(pro)/cys-tRNA(cys) deacylase [Paenibacillus sp. J2TS4]